MKYRYINYRNFTFFLHVTSFQLFTKPVFFNLFFEAEPFAAILIACGTGKGSWSLQHSRCPLTASYWVCGSAVSSLSGFSAPTANAFSMHQEPRKCVYNGHKCRLVPVSRFDSAEPFDAIGRTLRFRGTLL